MLKIVEENTNINSQKQSESYLVYFLTTGFSSKARTVGRSSGHSCVITTKTCHKSMDLVNSLAPLETYCSSVNRAHTCMMFGKSQVQILSWTLRLFFFAQKYLRALFYRLKLLTIIYFVG